MSNILGATQDEINNNRKVGITRYIKYMAQIEIVNGKEVMVSSKPIKVCMAIE